MKIEKNQIQIRGHISSSDLLKNLKPGSRVPVSITERLGQRYAVLDIGGSKVKAQFLQGVPNSEKLFLVLEKKDGGSIFFRIADDSQNESLLEELKNYTLFNRNDIAKSIHILRSHLKEGFSSIFALNRVLIKHAEYTEKNNKNEKLRNIFNKLLLKGANYKNLQLISEVLNARNSNITQLLYYIYSGLNLNCEYLSEKNILKDKINYFCDLINESLTEDEKACVIQDVLDIIANGSEKSDEQYGEILFFDDCKFKLCRYFLNDNNIIVSLSLSNLGEIDILLKEEKFFYTIAFYCENDESITALKSEISLLPFYNEKNFQVIFHNNKKSIEKIIEIISTIDLQYQLDVKA